MKRIGAYRRGRYLGTPEPVPEGADSIVGRYFGPEGSRWMTDEERAKMVVQTRRGLIRHLRRLGKLWLQ